MEEKDKVQVNEEDDENYNPEEEVTGDWKVKGLDLPEVEKVTGEEQEEELTSFRTKLYRFRDEQWKERGVGHLKFLQHKENKRIRLIMRSDKTLKQICNFYAQGPAPLCQLAPNKTTDKAYVFNCYDCSEEDTSLFAVEQLCTRFTSVEEFERFKVEFTKAYESNEVIRKAAQTTEEKEQEAKDQAEEKKE